MNRSENRYSLDLKLGPINLKSPIILASGTSGHSDELSRYGDLSSLGALTVKSLTMDPWEGNKPPRISSYGKAVINSVGLQGSGIKHFILYDYPRLEAASTNVILSIWAKTVDGYADIAIKIQEAVAAGNLKNVIGIELNISCPNLEDQNRLFSQSAEFTAAIASSFKKLCSLPMLVKLSPMVADPVEIANAAIESGADILTLTNTMFGIGVDAVHLKYELGNITGGVSGSSLKPLTQSIIKKIRDANESIAIVATGGIFTLNDMIEYWFLGANAVGIGTATLFNPRASFKLQKKLIAHLDKNGYKSFQQYWNYLQDERGKVTDGY